MNEDPQETLLTTRDLSKWLAIPVRTLCLWAETEEIPAIKIGRQWRFHKASVQQWLRSKASPQLNRSTP